MCLISCSFISCFQAITVSEVAPAQSTLHRQVQTELTSNTLPLRKRPGILHLRSCGDLSSFTWAQLQTGPERRTGTHSRTNSRMGSRAGSRRLEQERPHSLIGVFRETVLWVTSQTDCISVEREETDSAPVGWRYNEHHNLTEDIEHRWFRFIFKTYLFLFSVCILNIIHF